MKLRVRVLLRCGKVRCPGSVFSVEQIVHRLRKADVRLAQVSQCRGTLRRRRHGNSNAHIANVLVRRFRARARKLTDASCFDGLIDRKTVTPCKGPRQYGQTVKRQTSSLFIQRKRTLIRLRPNSRRKNVPSGRQVCGFASNASRTGFAEKAWKPFRVGRLLLACGPPPSSEA